MVNPAADDGLRNARRRQLDPGGDGFERVGRALFLFLVEIRGTYSMNVAGSRADID